MLINALCDYYDILAEQGEVLPEGYSRLEVHYVISLTTDGVVDGIIDYREEREEYDKNAKRKTIRVPREVVVPERTEKTAIESNIIEHRAQYIFGLNYDQKGNNFSAPDEKDKAYKSHLAFKKKNLKFIEGLHSDVVNAYREFINNWNPENETENQFLKKLEKDYANSKYAFCLSGSPDKLLHDNSEIKEKWESVYKKMQEDEDTVIAQSALSGKEERIARIHNKIKGVVGGQSSGTVLIGFNNNSENSYGNEQSYNSNISKTSMRKYTESLNYLMSGKRHKILLDETTVFFWSMAKNTTNEDLFRAIAFGENDEVTADEVNEMLKALLENLKEGKLIHGNLDVNMGTDFYIVGVKPNATRLSVKFIYRAEFGEILMNAVRHQELINMSDKVEAIPLWRLKKELVSPKSKNEKVSPELLSKLFRAIVYGEKYPVSLLETVIRRIKTDQEVKTNQNIIRTGIVKAYLNRNYKEGYGVALNKESRDTAYLCGRLFATLEKLQEESAGGKLNRTIKDAYFSSAVSRPAMIFPKIIKLAQNHLNKITNTASQVFFSKLIGEIIDLLENEFPNMLSLQEQGKFIIGYYHQRQSFFKKKSEENDG